jgi:gas vesicle protein
MNKTVKLTGVFLAGAGAGAAVALLYAPEKGVRTRSAIKRYAIRKGVRLEELKEQLLSAVDDFSHTVENSVSSCLEKTKDAFEETRAPVRQVLRKLGAS